VKPAPSKASISLTKTGTVDCSGNDGMPDTRLTQDINPITGGFLKKSVQKHIPKIRRNPSALNSLLKKSISFVKKTWY